MGQRMNSNFKKRFGDRVGMVYRERPLIASEQKLQNEALAKAVTQALAGTLKREPTNEELLGVIEIKDIRAKR